MIIKPPTLKSGNRVIIISPSQPISNPRKFKSGVKALKGLGFETVVSSNAEMVYGMYKAGDARTRADDLNNAFSDKTVKAIFMSSGGFLANGILPFLDYDLIQKNPKIIIGFSDGATVLNAIFEKTGLVTFYGFNIEHFSTRATKFTNEAFSNLVQNGRTDFPVKTKWQILQKGEAKGVLLGGNLLSFANLLGTPYSPNLKRSLLFVEEHDEWSEDMENAFNRLILADSFSANKIQGIILGKMINVDIGSGDSELRKKKRPRRFTFRTMIKDKFSEYQIKVPILANVDFGLIRDLITVPIGIEARLALSRGKIEFYLTEPAVS